MTTSNRLIVLDFDDTLCQTSSILSKFAKTDIAECSSIEEMKLVAEHDDKLKEFLESMTKIGTVVIVTAATTSWVWYALDLYPKAKDAVVDLEIDIKSTCDVDMMAYPKVHPSLLKKDCIVRCLTDNVEEVISIGDSEIEMFATKMVCKERKLTYKIIKFVPKPSAQQLTFQLKVCMDAMPLLAKHRSNLEMATQIQCLSH